MELSEETAHFRRKGTGFLNSEGNIERAAVCYSRAIKLNPKEPTSYFCKSLNLKARGKKKYALYCMSQAINLGSSSLNHCLAYKGKILNEMGRNEEAVDCYDEAIKINP